MTIAHVISDQVAEAGPARVPGRRVLRSACASLDLTALERRQGAHRGVCFCKWNMSVLQAGLEAPLAGSVGEVCCIRPFCLSWLSEKRGQKSWQEVSQGEGSACSLLRYVKIPATFNQEKQEGEQACGSEDSPEEAKP